MLEKGLPERTLLNVNVPSRAAGRALVTVQGRRDHAASVQQGIDSRRQAYYWIEEGRGGWERDEMSDIHAVREGLISVTPLHTDTTHHATVERFRSWESDLNG